MNDAMAMPRPTAARERGLGRTAYAVLTGVLGHGALLVLALQQQPRSVPPVRVTEVELLAQPRPAPEAEPVPVLVPEPSAPAAEPRMKRRATSSQAQATPAPQPASAAPLHTLDERVRTNVEPVRFVTDPHGSAFGLGQMARGGTAKPGVATSAPSTPEPAVEPERNEFAPTLSRAPMLAESEPCRGFFPARAQADRGEVKLKVRIEADGRVRSVALAREVPSGQGFGFAARDCLLSKRFTPALDLDGEPVSAVSPVTVLFSR